MNEKTWTITDADGRNARTVTIAQYLAEVRAAKIKAERIAERSYGVKFANPTPETHDEYGGTTGVGLPGYLR